MAHGGAAEQRLLGLLGLGLRGRLAVVGVQQVRVAARRGTLVLAVLASDASMNSQDKLVPLLRAKRIRFIEGPAAAVLGAALGRRPVAAIGVIDRNLARGLLKIAVANSAGPR